MVTGAAGFIGSNLVLELLRTVKSIKIIGLDNMNDYYDVAIKEWRLKQIEKLDEEVDESEWTFIQGNIADRAVVDNCFEKYDFDVILTTVKHPTHELHTNKIF